MQSKLDLQISELRGTMKNAFTSPFMPATARLSILQLFEVIETMAAELDSLKQTLACHCHLRAVA